MRTRKTTLAARLISLAGAGLMTVAVTVAGPLPAGFEETVVFSGLKQPTAVAFSPDGRVFVAEKSGNIQVFASLTATTPTIFANLSNNVFNGWDRGLLGLALDPGFPATPYVYVLYTYDGDIGGAAPKWGTPGVLTDPCPDPPGATGDGCTVSGRLSRLEASGSVMTGTELVLINNWFQQYPSHSLGSIVFGSDGALYASSGDAASYTFADYGQKGIPLNPGGDPPVGVGGVQTPPTAEGGALRSQDVRSSGDPRVTGWVADPRGSGDGGGACREPALFQLRRQRAPHRGPRSAQPVPFHDAARHGGDLDRRRGVGHLGGDQPGHQHRDPDQLRVAMLRGGSEAGCLRRCEPQPVREPLRDSDGGDRTLFCVPTPGRTPCPGSPAPTEAHRSLQLPSTRARATRPPTREPSFSGTTRASACG